MKFGENSARPIRHPSITSVSMRELGRRRYTSNHHISQTWYLGQLIVTFDGISVVVKKMDNAIQEFSSA